eukprot:6303175-Lingulodinium_polyedra.AAC.1
MRSSWPSAATADRKLHARALHAHARFLACAWNAERARIGAASALHGCCLHAAWELLGNSFGC